jgi:hypothetical protein
VAVVVEAAVLRWRSGGFGGGFGGGRFGGGGSGVLGRRYYETYFRYSEFEKSMWKEWLLEALAAT